MSYTKGPWVVEMDAHGRGRIKSNGCWIATTWTCTDDDNSVRYPADENAQRIVDCVNACAGLNPEALQALMKCAVRLAENETTDAAAPIWALIEDANEAIRKAVDIK
jgi:hypothetical protein